MATAPTAQDYAAFAKSLEGLSSKEQAKAINKAKADLQAQGITVDTALESQYVTPVLQNTLNRNVGSAPTLTGGGSSATVGSGNAGITTGGGSNVTTGLNLSPNSGSPSMSVNQGPSSVTVGSGQSGVTTGMNPPTGGTGPGSASVGSGNSGPTVTGGGTSPQPGVTVGMNPPSVTTNAFGVPIEQAPADFAGFSQQDIQSYVDQVYAASPGDYFGATARINEDLAKFNQAGYNISFDDVSKAVQSYTQGQTSATEAAGTGTSAGAGVGTNVTTGGTGPLATGNREGIDALVSNVTTQAGSTPSLPAGTKVTTEDIKVDPTNEIIADITSLGDVTTTTKTAGTPDAVSDPTKTTYSNIGTTTAAENVTDATAATSDSPLAGALISDEDVAQGTVSGQSLVTAAQGTVSQEATVQYQIGELMASIEAGQPLPAWAAGAARGATQVMQQRGLGASSMASAAMIQSLMEAGIPIAAADAQTYAAMDIANLNNKQQAVLQNAATYAAMDRANLDVRAQAQQSNARAFLSIDLQSLTNKQKTNELNYQGELQAILTDAAAENATAQFNAKNQVQIDQFFAELGVQVDNANANRKAAVDQFNVSEANAMTQFTEALNDARERFSAQMQLQVDQSNAQWRRDVNTANTAATNEANRINAQNLLNINQQALNNLWQRYRDEAAWAVQMSENANQRAHQVGILAMENQYNTELYETQFQNEGILALGQTAIELVYGIYKDS